MRALAFYYSSYIIIRVQYKKLGSENTQTFRQAPYHKKFSIVQKSACCRKMTVLLYASQLKAFSDSLHLPLQVTGELSDHLTSWDALQAALPVGTVSGAPKVLYHLPSSAYNNARGFKL